MADPDATHVTVRLHPADARALLDLAVALLDRHRPAGVEARSALVSTAAQLTCQLDRP